MASGHRAAKWSALIVWDQDRLSREVERPSRLPRRPNYPVGAENLIRRIWRYPSRQADPRAQCSEPNQSYRPPWRVLRTTSGALWGRAPDVDLGCGGWALAPTCRCPLVVNP